nr:hypothetical protein CFP56_78878 [Quercus suber]
MEVKRASQDPSQSSGRRIVACSSARFAEQGARQSAGRQSCRGPHMASSTREDGSPNSQTSGIICEASESTCNIPLDVRTKEPSTASIRR